MVEYLAAKKGLTAKLSKAHIPQWLFRMVYRSIYVAFVGFIAVLLPYFGGLMLPNM